MNVIRPAGIQEPLPVVVWLHGGAFTHGGSGDARYNLSFIVQNSVEMKQPVIAVSLNYRLSVWGFLYSWEVAISGAANSGLKDQRLALHWLQENIAAFGGTYFLFTHSQNGYF